MSKRTSRLEAIARLSAALAVFGAVGLIEACAPPAIDDDSHGAHGSSKKHGDTGDGSRQTMDATLDPEVSTALEQFPDAEVLASRRGVPTFVRGTFGRIATTVQDGSDLPVRMALVKVAPVFKLSADNLRLTRVKTDLLEKTHAHYQQTKNGLPVVGGDLILHLDNQGTLYAVSGGARDGAVNLPSQPKLAGAFAESVAAEALGAQATTQPARLVYLQPQNAKMHLTWEVNASQDGDLMVHELIYVDAIDGSVVERRSLVHTAAVSRSIHSLDQAVLTSLKQLPGKLLRSEGGAASTDTVANGNYDLMASTHDCYSRLFARDSFDGKGGALISSIHGKFSDGKTGSAGTPNNAAWFNDAHQMVYGDGDGQTFSNLAIAFDVTAHEVGHGITASEANLTYDKESGAINEAMSDIFAAVCDYDKTKSFDAAWKIGESVYTPSTTGDALRYMDNPTKDKHSYDYYPERYLGTDDHGGVHANSGIGNLAFVLLTSGGKHPRAKTATEVTGIGIQKASAIFYRALTEYMTSATDFLDARATTAHAARDLYGADAETAVNAAWDAVGVPRLAAQPAPQPKQQTDAGGAPAPTPAPGGESKSAYGCCVNGQCYDCPSKDALDKCAGFDLSACISACADVQCMLDCNAKARGATHDPSACTAR